MTIALTPLVIAVIGLLMFFFAPGKWSEVGKLIFFCAFLAFCLPQGTHSATFQFK